MRTAVVRRKFAIVERILKSASIAAFVETHGSDEDLAVLERAHPLFHWLGSFCDNRVAGGVVIGVRRTICARADITRSELCPGRMLAISCATSNGTLGFCGAHFSPRLSLCEFRQQAIALHDWTNSGPEFKIVTGDFNAIADSEDLYDLASNRATGKDFEKYRLLLSTCPKLVEVHQCEHTRYQRQRGTNIATGASRIDMIFIDACEMETNDLNIAARILCDAPTIGCASDNLPITLSISNQARRPHLGQG